MHAALERFRDAIPPRPYASAGRFNGEFSHARLTTKNEALDMALLQVNTRCQSCITIDIDHSDAGYAWMDTPGVPEPNLISVNPANGHAQITWQLQTPVWRRKKDDDRIGEAKPVRYLEAVKTALRHALNGDPYYNGLMVKNPFHKGWTTTALREDPYSLGELSAHLDLGERPQDACLHDSGIGRNVTLFDSIRFWGYRAKKRYGNFSMFRDDLFLELDRLNDLLDMPLPYREIHGIGKSVSHWVWSTYTGSGKARNRGVMDLDKSLPIRERQHLGQTYTCEQRISKTLCRISNAIDRLRNTDSPVTISAIAELANLSRTTVYEYRKRNPELFTESVTLESDSISEESSCILEVPPPTYTLIPTQLDRDFASTLEYFSGNRIRAIQEAVAWAQRGQKMPGTPKMLESALQRVVDKAITTRQIYDESTIIGSARRFSAN